MSAQPEQYHNVSQSRYAVPAYADPAGDEISLIDLWLVLVRRRALVAGVVALAVAVGFAAAFLVPPRYAYSTTIEIGTQIVNERVAPIEGQDSVRAKVAESYVPLVLQQYQHELGDDANRYEIEVSAPKNSQVLVLNSQGSIDDEATYKRLHSLVIERLQEDHQRVSNVLRKGIEVRIAERERKIEALLEEKRLLDAQIKRIENERELLRGEIAQVETLLAESEKERAEAIGEATDAARAMTLMLLSEQLRQTRTRQAELKQRVMIELPNKRDELEKALSDNRLAQEDQRAGIEELRQSLVGMLETRAVAPPIRLSEPLGPGKAVILVLSAIVGLMVAVFMAFFAEFLSKAKAQMEEGLGTTNS